MNSAAVLASHCSISFSPMVAPLSARSLAETRLWTELHGYVGRVQSADIEMVAGAGDGDRPGVSNQRPCLTFGGDGEL
jgi:hypothetical protein